MVIEPAVLIAFIGAILALIGLIIRAFVSGELMNPAKAVPREDYEALRDIHASYVEPIGRLVDGVEKLSVSVNRVATNGVPKERI